MSSPAEIFPVLGLSITAGPLELRGMDDATIAELADLAARGVHPPDQMPFAVPWTDEPPETFRLSFARHHWGVRSRFSPESWNLDLAVSFEGQLVGTQGVSTRDFLVTRTGETGSWLGQEFQGRGIGTMMRRAMCTFLFDHLDFVEVTSAAFEDNIASARVSERIGYRPNGSSRVSRRDDVAVVRNFVLGPDDLDRVPGLEVEGGAPLRKLIGLD